MKTRYVYFLYKDGECVYVGKASNVYLRLQSHYNDKRKEFTHFSFFKLYTSNTNVDLDSCSIELERTLIFSIRPKYNKIISTPYYKPMPKDGYNCYSSPMLPYIHLYRKSA